jgi:chromosome partitioning protein
MRIIGNLASKGGVGKTTLTIHLAVRALEDGFQVAVMDTNYPQGSLTQVISAIENDQVVLLSPSAAALPRTVAEANDLGYDFIFIDGTPDQNHNLQSYAPFCDLILIPTETSVQDRAAVRDALDILPQRIKHRAFVVLNKVRPRRKGIENQKTVLTQEFLAELGYQVCPITLARNVDFEDSFEVGKTVTQYKPKSAPALEINHLWAWIQDKIND